MAQPTIGAQASRLTKDLVLNPPSISTLPRILYGTAWKKKQTADLVYMALKSGYRAIDTAAQPKHYDERGVGAGVQLAVNKGIIKREDIFVQTKFTPPSGQSRETPYDPDAPLVEKVHQSIKSSLSNFTIPGQAPYLDSVVLHSPMGRMQETLEVWKTLESYAPDQIRNLGICNVSLRQLEILFDKTTLKPSIVQNRLHDRTLYEVELRKWCKDKGIAFQSFWTVTANPDLVSAPPCVNIKKHVKVDLNAAYLSLVLGLEGVSVLDGTTSEKHMKQNLEGIEKVGIWAEGEGASEWESSLTEFRKLIKDS